MRIPQVGNKRVILAILFGALLTAALVVLRPPENPRKIGPPAFYSLKREWVLVGSLASENGMAPHTAVVKSIETNQGMLTVFLRRKDRSEVALSAPLTNQLEFEALSRMVVNETCLFPLTNRPQNGSTGFGGVADRVGKRE